MPIKSQLHTCRHFTGRNLHSPPQDLAEGEMTVCDSLRVDGGSLVPRPGFWGQLTTPFGTPLYAPLAYLTANGDGTQTGTDVLLSTAGRIYHWAKGAAAASEIVPTGITAGSVRSATARWARLGHYAYLADGQAGQPLLKVDLAGATSATALSAPAAAPTSSLTSTVLDAFTDASSWQPDSLTSAQTNQVVNGDFTGGGTAGPGSPSADYLSQAGWDGHGVSVDYYNNPAGHAGVWENCDTPGDYIVSTSFIANFTQTLDGARKATEFFLSYKAFSLDNQNRGSLVATVIAYDAAGNEIARLSKETQIPFTGGSGTGGSQVNTYPAVYSFGDLGVPIAQYKVQFQNGLQNQLGTDRSVYLSGIVSYPTVPPVSLAAGSGGLVVSVAQAAGGPQMFLSGAHLRHTFASAQDLSQTATLAIGLGTGAALLSGLAFRLRMQKSGSTAWYDTNPAKIDLAAGVATVDVTTASIPADVRASCAKIEIVFTSDVTYTGPGQIVLGPLTAAGNLSVGDAPYTWVFTEIDGTADPVNLVNVIESDPSPVSVALAPTALQAQAILTLPALANAAATHRRVYRRGGAFPDGLGRLLATVPVGTDTVIGGDPGLVSWSHTPRTLRDDTPDSFLQASTVVFLTTGRGAPPTGAQAICAWQSRIWLAVKGKLYASWAVTADQQAALYFNATNSASDPQNAIKGINFSVGQDDNDPIVGLVSMGGNQYFSKAFLVVLKQHSVWLVSGTDPSNFAIQQFLVGSGVGLAAARAASMVDGILWFLSTAGERVFNGDKPADASLPIEPDLHPVSGTPMTPAALAGALSVFHDRRLHLFAPLPGDTANTVCHVWDVRTRGWTRDRLPAAIPAVTGACSLSSQTDNGDLVVLSSSGQIFLQAAGQSVDKALPTSTGTPISWAVKGRGVGQEGDGPGMWRTTKALRLYAQALVAADTAATFTIDSDAGNLFSEAYTLSGLDSPALRVQNGVAGGYLVPGAAGTSAQAIRISSLAVETIEQGITHR